MLANEAKFLGPSFMLVRWVLTVVAIFIMAYAMGMIFKKKDLPQAEEEKEEVQIKPEYCIGCELCVELLPQVFAMAEGKAVVKQLPQSDEDLAAAQAVAERCPTGAIYSGKKIEKTEPVKQKT